MFSNTLARTSRVGLLRSRFTYFHKLSTLPSIVPKSNKSNIGLNRIKLAGFTSGAICLSQVFTTPIIRNDSLSAAGLPSQRITLQDSNQSIGTKSRFGVSWNYQELAMGSIVGLFMGVLVGKLSTILTFLAVSSYLLVQFLHSRGIVTIPWRKVVSLGSEKIDARTLVFEKPSFKFSFVSAFLIAAFNI